MSIHLVTGRQGQAHITGPDIRTQNRAIYGDDLYRLRDLGGNSIVYVSGNYIVVQAGSYMWYGMHIKIDADYSIAAEFSSGTQGWRVYFDYAKTANGNDYIETVTIGADNSSTIPAGFASDASTTAQVNICTFSTNGGAIVGDIIYNCPLVNTIRADVDTLFADGATNTAAIATNAAAIATNTSDVSNLKTRMTTAEGKITTDETNISTNTSNITKISRPYHVLYNNTTGKNIGDTIENSSIPYKNYRSTIFRLSNGCVGQMYLTGTDYTGTGFSSYDFLSYLNNSPFYYYSQATSTAIMSCVCHGVTSNNDLLISVIRFTRPSSSNTMTYNSNCTYRFASDGTITVDVNSEAVSNPLKITAIIGVDPVTTYQKEQ